MIKEQATKYSGINLAWDTETNECWISFGNNCQNYINQYNKDIMQQAVNYIEMELLPSLKH